MTYSNSMYTKLFRRIIASRVVSLIHLRTNSNHNKFVTFEHHILFRRDQARKSVLVEVTDEYCIDEALKICKSFGTLKTSIVFNTNGRQLVCLVEYESADEVSELLKNCTHSLSGASKVFSRFLQCSKKGERSLQTLLSDGDVKLYGRPNDQDIFHDLASTKNVNEQLLKLYKYERLPDLGSRLRYQVCTQVENSLSGIFPQCQSLPFGSSVNGFGRYDSDLDIAIDIDSTHSEKAALIFQPPSRLIRNDRTRNQMTLEVVCDIIHCFFPCSTNIKRILNAKVPIIKMHHTLTNLECDLSISNDTGFIMSELLFLYGKLDSRVRPLVFFLRKWAKCMLLTHDDPGAWITNFSLTLMIIFFLQTRTPHVLPSLEVLKSLADPEDETFAAGVDCTFQRNFKKVPSSENTEDLETLLFGFFTFYKNISFQDSAFSILTGEVCQKPDRSPLFIQNPLEHDLNVSRNVNLDNSQQFKYAISKSLHELEKKSSDGGICKLLPNYTTQLHPRSSFIKSLMSMQNSDQSVIVSEATQSSPNTSFLKSVLSMEGTTNKTPIVSETTKNQSLMKDVKLSKTVNDNDQIVSNGTNNLVVENSNVRILKSLPVWNSVLGSLFPPKEGKHYKSWSSKPKKKKYVKMYRN